MTNHNWAYTMDIGWINWLTIGNDGWLVMVVQKLNDGKWWVALPLDKTATMIVDLW